MLAIERRNAIIDNLNKTKKVLVNELSKDFQVSEETIRRDLDKICKDDQFIKTHGGAILKESLQIELPFNIRKKHNINGKQEMAKIVETLIKDGDHIILDASTTAVFIAKAIKHKKNLTILTNSIEILIELSDVSGWEIISCGGTLDESHLALLGHNTSEFISKYNVEKLFFSCKGLDIENGISDGAEQFSHIKKTMLNFSNKSILVVDCSKFGTKAFSKIDDIVNLDIIVTDIKPAQEWLDIFKKLQVECLYPLE